MSKLWTLATKNLEGSVLLVTLNGFEDDYKNLPVSIQISVCSKPC